MIKNKKEIFKLEIACNDICLESEDLNNIIKYAESKDNMDLNIYNEDTLKGRRKSQILKYQNSARLMPFILMHKEKDVISNMKALYTESNDVTYENVIDFFEDNKDSKMIKAFDIKGNSIGVYYPEIDKFVKN